MSTVPSTTGLQKTDRSYTGSHSHGRAFGEARHSVKDLDTLASESTGRDPDLSYLMSVISAWAYADERALFSKLRYYGVKEARIRRVTVQNNALLVVTTAYLIQSQSGKVGVLAFRGTDPANIINVLTDSQVMQYDFAGGRVHSGFYASVEAVWDEIHDAIDAARTGAFIRHDGSREQLSSPLEALYLTGHSLGGAMAQLAAARLHQADYVDWAPERLIRGVYTYGQPMVGDKKFAEACEGKFKDRLFRHVYRRDPVPHLPPRSEFEYAHAGPERRAAGREAPWEETTEKTSRTRLLPALAEVFVNAVEARTMSRDRFPGLSIDDHSPGNYMDVCRHVLEQSPDTITRVAPANGIWASVKRWCGVGAAKVGLSMGT